MQYVDNQEILFITHKKTRGDNLGFLLVTANVTTNL